MTMTHPGDLANKANSIPQREQSLVYVLKELIRHQNDLRALMTALRLNPDVDTVEDAVAMVEALVAFYEANA